MIFSKLPGQSLIPATLLVGVLALAGCATEDIDDTTGSRLQQLPLGADNKPPAPIEAGDIAIAGQDFSHDIRELPQVSDASVPPLVRFGGVTSVIKGENNLIVPIDTEPYTTLLRDRLLLGDREKLRFVERQLPPLTLHTKHSRHEVTSPGESAPADFQVLAELRGKLNSDFYRIQIEFVDARSGQVLLNEVYRIRKEAGGEGNYDQLSNDDSGQPPPPTQNPDNSQVSPVPPEEEDTGMAPGAYNPPPPPNQQ